MQNNKSQFAAREPKAVGVAMGAAPEHNLGVQGTRGLSALAIFVFHILKADVPGLAVLQGGVPEMIVDALEWSVELFFAISGFVILGALRRSQSPQAFARDRAIRIYPVLWAAIAVSGAHGLLFNSPRFSALSTEALLGALPANLIGLPGIFPIFIYHPLAWTISYEIAFYLSCAIACGLHLRFGPRIALAIWLPVAIALLASYPRALFFVVGLVVAAGWPDRIAIARHLSRYPAPMLIAAIAGWSVVQALSAPTHMVHTTLLDWAVDWRLPVAVLSLAAATLALQGIVSGRGLLSALLKTRPLLGIGLVSYSFYLWHIPVIGVVKRLMIAFRLDQAAGTWSQVVMFLLALPLTLLVAYVSWRVIEIGICGWLRRSLRPAAPTGRTWLGETSGL